MSDRRGFDKIIGQELAKQVLLKALRAGNPTHAYLFLGLEGTGKHKVALEFAKALNCLDPRDGSACDECAHCHSLDHGNMPDVRVWSPDGKNTKIDQMREMRDEAMLKPMRARWKVNIIEQGDTLNEESANCILKLLEEPPEYLINIVLFRNAATILPTIRSRCQLVRFTQVSAAELIDRLLADFGVANDEARFLAAYSEGCPGRAIRLIDDELFAERRAAIIGTAEAAASGTPWLALKLAGTLRGAGGKAVDEADEEEDTPAQPQARKSKSKNQRDTVIESLDMLLLWYRDLLAVKLQGEGAAVVNVDRWNDIGAQVMSYPHAGRLLNSLEAILQAKRAILGNASAQITTEALMMRLVAG